MPKVRAAICHEFGTPLRLQEAELRAPGPGEIEVRLGAVAICHSDLSYMDGIWGGSLPAVFGHEAAGEVLGCGLGVVGIKPGDRVVVTLIRACGQCPSCASGHPVQCETGYDGDHGPLSMPDGGKLQQAMACGAFAERVVIDQSQVARAPAELPYDQACLLACGVITGVGAVVNAAGLRPGQDAVVIGAGGVGLNAIQGARIAGARRIVAVDLAPEKLEAALDFGATHAISAAHPEPWSLARQALGRGADAVLVTVGALAAFDAAPNYLATGGKMVMVGMPAVGGMAQYEAVNIAGASQQMLGTKMGDTVIARDLPWLMDLALQGRLKLEELIGGRWRFDQINEAIAEARKGSARRQVLIFD